MSVARPTSFDFVVVGAGSAGCTLAARLTEHAGVPVLLLEAGGWDRDPWIHIPLGWPHFCSTASTTGCISPSPRRTMDGRALECARGKVIGGSSSINAMAYVRGHRGDYDRWARRGLPAWSYANVLPYFRRQETLGGRRRRLSRRRRPADDAVHRATADPLVDAYCGGRRGRGLSGRPRTTTARSRRASRSCR